MTTKDPEPTFGHRSVKRFKNHHAHVTVEVSGLPPIKGLLTGGLFTPDKVAFSLRLGVDGEWKSEPIHPCVLHGPADMSFGERDSALIDRETPWLARLIATHAEHVVTTATSCARDGVVRASLTLCPGRTAADTAEEGYERSPHTYIQIPRAVAADVAEGRQP